MLMVDFRKWGADTASAVDFTVMNAQVQKIVEDYDFGAIIYFANNIKATIFQKTNNISLLSIIEDVGCQFDKELPGYALDLATCMDIIFWDIQRFSRLNPDAVREKLEKQILQILQIVSALYRHLYPLCLCYT